MISTISHYDMLVQQFRHITKVVDPESGRCCSEVKDGVPACCQDIIDGDGSLTFTPPEVGVLLGKGVHPKYFLEADDSEQAPASALFELNDTEFTKEQLAEALHTGWLADTLESASHPTRPIVGLHGVMGIALIDGCNTKVGLEHYREHKGELLNLWQLAVANFGVKPYYGTYHLKESWTIL